MVGGMVGGAGGTFSDSLPAVAGGGCAGD